MTHAILEACVACARESEKPLPVRQIRERLERGLRFPPRRAPEFQELLKERARAGEICEWPGRSPRFWGTSLADCVQEALLAVLAEGPFLEKPLLKRIQPRLHGVNAKQTCDEARAVLPRLESDGRLYKAIVSRQPFYISRGWALKFGGPPPPAPPAPQPGGLEESILAAVAGLEPGYGNYVPVYQLRAAEPVRAAFDRAVIALADAGKLVLAGYGGAESVPPERIHYYVEDAQRRLYVAVARPHPPGVS